MTIDIPDDLARDLHPGYAAVPATEDDGRIEPVGVLASKRPDKVHTWAQGSNRRVGHVGDVAVALVDDML